MEMHGEQAALRRVQAAPASAERMRGVGLAHREVELLVDQEELEPMSGKGVEELAEARR